MESAYSPSDWAALAAAELGAAAGLTGLVFVGVSINLERIMKLPTLPDRALEAILLLSSILLSSTLVLVPGQGIGALAVELIVLGLALWAGVAMIDWRMLTNPSTAQYRPTRLVEAFLSQGAALSLTLAGATLVLHAAGGLYWLVPATVLALISAVGSAWVLLVEIMR